MSASHSSPWARASRSAWGTAGRSMKPIRAVTWVMPSAGSPRGSIRTRSPPETWGTFTDCTVRMTMLRWRTWLCWRLARSASGVVSKDGCRNTAVPGTRSIGGEAASISATNSGSGPLHGVAALGDRPRGRAARWPAA